MPCSCHINPPCGYCEQIYECAMCGGLKHPDDNGLHEIEQEAYCDSCVEEKYEQSN